MKGATDLYQLAFLITGSGELAAEWAADAIASERALRLRHLHVTLWTPRLLVIEEALAAVVDEFVTSARRTVTNQPDLSDLPRLTGNSTQTQRQPTWNARFSTSTSFPGALFC